MSRARPSLPHTGRMPERTTLTGPPPADGSAVAQDERPAPRLDAGRRFRPDVEGLRSVAVVLVVLYHAGVPGVSGGYVGVDVFFVLSGFLITGLLLEEVRRTGRVRLARFYGRRARRLLPLATLVLLATVGASLAVLPPLERSTLGGDVLGAALYAANWRYAVEATDYLGADSAESPLLHYWSLGVEEQFYLVWPLLLLLVAFGGRGGWARTRRRVAVGLAALGTGSLVLSVWLTPVSGSWAYFGLHTRAWELAAGAAAAVALPVLARLPRAGAQVAGWLGLAVVLWSAFAFDEATVFPGTAALAPVLGTVLVVAAGVPEAAGGTARLFAVPALRYVGRVSYAWYLWHWPCLVLTRELTEGQPSTSQLALAVVVSFVLAAASHVLVENPVRHARPLAANAWRSVGLGAALTALAVVLGLALNPFREPPRVADRSLPVLQGTVAGPGGTADMPTVPVMTPEQAQADRDKPEGCWADYEGTVPPPASACLFGDPDGDVSVALVGDSHAGSWLPALDALGRERGWKVYVYVKSACTPIDLPTWNGRLDREYTECERWDGAVRQRLEEAGGVDAVLVARSWLYQVGRDGKEEDAATLVPRWRAAAERTFAELTDVGRQVVMLRDTPQAPYGVPACLSEHDPAAWQACSFPAAGNTHLDALLSEAEHQAGAGSDVRWVDMTERLCPQGTCPVVAANGAVVYLDSEHFTETFSRSARGLLAAELDALGLQGLGQR